MVNNKKGYMRILEAIVALVIVLAYVISILPKVQQSTGETPPEMAAIQKAVLDQVQNNERFRTCMVYGRIVYTEGTTPKGKEDVECMNDLIRGTLPPFSPWKYAFALCEVTSGQCKYVPGRIGNDIITADTFGTKVLPKDTSVYSKSLFLSVPDVTTSFYVPPGNNQPQQRILRLYMWSSV